MPRRSSASMAVVPLGRQPHPVAPKDAGPSEDLGRTIVLVARLNILMARVTSCWWRTAGMPTLPT